MPVKFTFFGAMCVLVERSDGKKLLFDPYISGNPQTTVPLETCSSPTTPGTTLGMRM